MKLIAGESGLTEMQGEVDGVRVLDARQHGLALPPGGVQVVVVVGQVQGTVVVPGVVGVADVAGLGDAGGAGLDTILLRRGAAGVGGRHRHVERGVNKLGHAALRRVALIRALVHGGAGAYDQPAPSHQSPDHTRHFPLLLSPAEDLCAAPTPTLSELAQSSQNFLKFTNLCPDDKKQKRGVKTCGGAVRWLQAASRARVPAVLCCAALRGSQLFVSAAM